MFELLLNKPTFDLWTNNQKMQLVVDEHSSLFCSSINDEENFYDTDQLSINFWKTFMTRKLNSYLFYFFPKFYKIKVFIEQSKYILNIFYRQSFNGTTCIRHQCKKIAVLSCHRFLINSGVENMNNISIWIRTFTTRCLQVRGNVGIQTINDIF